MGSALCYSVIVILTVVGAYKGIKHMLKHPDPPAEIHPEDVVTFDLVTRDDIWEE